MCLAAWPDSEIFVRCARRCLEGKYFLPGPCLRSSRPDRLSLHRCSERFRQFRTPAQEDKVCKHVMKTYSYYQDVKCTVWERKHFTVNAASQQEADEIAKRCVVGNVHDQTDGNILALEEDEMIYDTMDLFPLEENHGSPTIEVYRKDHKFIADNSPKR